MKVFQKKTSKAHNTSRVEFGKPLKSQGQKTKNASMIFFSDQPKFILNSRALTRRDGHDFELSRGFW